MELLNAYYLLDLIPGFGAGMAGVNLGIARWLFAQAGLRVYGISVLISSALDGAAQKAHWFYGLLVTRLPLRRRTTNMKGLYKHGAFFTRANAAIHLVKEAR